MKACLAFATCLLVSAAAAEPFNPRAPLTVRDVGEYAAVPWDEPGKPIEPGSRAERVRDLTFAVSSVNLTDDTTSEQLEHWARVARWGVEQGRKLLPRVYFWDGSDRYEGPMREIEVYWRRLDAFLSVVDPENLHAIVLAEENVPYGGRPEVLAELYRRTKAKYGIPVWQWWSPYSAVPGSGGWIPADGWVVDPYFMPRDAFRRYLRKYLITGVPVVVMPWASDEREPTPEEWQANLDQLEVAIEFGLPVAFYWVAQVPGASYGTCYFPGRRDAKETLMDRINHLVWDYIARVRALPADFAGLPSADLAQGTTLELGPVEDETFVYADDFSTSLCVDDAEMTGFRDLVLNGDTLSARGFRGRPTRAELVYHFSGDCSARYPEVTLRTWVDPDLHGQVEIALSGDGREWGPRVQTGGNESGSLLRLLSEDHPTFALVKEFWVWVILSGEAGSTDRPACRIDDLRISAPVVPPAERAAVLRPDPEVEGGLIYRDDFRTRKYLVTATVVEDRGLEWTPGQLSVRLRPGGSSVAVVWRVVSDVPLADIRIELNGGANTGYLGTDHFLDASVDGDTWTETVTTAGRPTDVNGWVWEPLVLDLTGNDRYTGLREFYVRLRMTAQDYQAVHPVDSGRVNGFVIRARSAAP